MIFPLEYVPQLTIDMVKHELRVASYELQVASYELRVKSLKARVESLKARVEIQKCELKSTSYEFKSTSYEFRSTNCEFITLSPMILEKFAFSFAFNLRKQNVTDFSFISLTQNFVLCH